ncbi:MAG TPA: hypothetical protein VGB82_07930 [Alphaproteobacteria bacterium]
MAPASRRARRLMAALAGGLAAALLASGPGGAQSSADMEIAQEFLALELAGWRLPDPVEQCLTGLSLRRLEPMAYGSEDLIDQPDLVDPPGPFFRILRIDPDPGNPRRRTVQFEWLLPGPGGTTRPLRDSFTFALSGNPAAGIGRPVMQHEPDHMVIRRECYGG